LHDLRDETLLSSLNDLLTDNGAGGTPSTTLVSAHTSADSDSGTADLFHVWTAANRDSNASPSGIEWPLGDHWSRPTSLVAMAGRNVRNDSLKLMADLCLIYKDSFEVGCPPLWALGSPSNCIDHLQRLIADDLKL